MICKSILVFNSYLHIDSLTFLFSFVSAVKTDNASLAASLSGLSVKASLASSMITVRPQPAAFLVPPLATSSRRKLNLSISVCLVAKRGARMALRLEPAVIVEPKTGTFTDTSLEK